MEYYQNEDKLIAYHKLLLTLGTLQSVCLSVCVSVTNLAQAYDVHACMQQIELNSVVLLFMSQDVQIKNLQYSCTTYVHVMMHLIYAAVHYTSPQTQKLNSQGYMCRDSALVCTIHKQDIILIPYLINSSGQSQSGLLPTTQRDSILAYLRPITSWKNVEVLQAMRYIHVQVFRDRLLYQEIRIMFKMIGIKVS